MRTLAEDSVYQLLQNDDRTWFSNTYFIIPINKVIEIFKAFLSCFSFHEKFILDIRHILSKHLRVAVFFKTIQSLFPLLSYLSPFVRLRVLRAQCT